MFPASSRLVPSIAPTRVRAVLLPAAVFLFFLASFAFTQSGDIFSTGDTTIRIEVAENILGRFSVQLHGWKLQFPRHIKKEYLDPRIDRGSGGYTYSTYLLGQPLAIIPFDWLGSQFAIHQRWPYGPTVIWIDHMVGPLFGALEVMIFFLFAVRLGFGIRRASLLTLIFGFATSVWPDEQSVLEHTEVAFFLLLGMYFAFRFREQGRGSRFLVYAGLAVAGAAITRYQDAAVGVLAISLYLVLPGGRAPGVWPRIRWLLLAGLGLLPGIAVDIWYNEMRYGRPFASGHHEQVFGYPIWKGIPGLLVSPGKGLLWYCPVILLVFIAAPRFFRRYPALAVASATMAAGFVLLYSYVNYWHGDPAWGPRYIFPIIPFLTLPLGTLFTSKGRNAVAIWILTGAVVAASFGIQVAAVSVSQWRTWYRVISYEENQGHQWDWISSRYRYFWNIHESPLNFQIHGLYQLAYDDFLHSSKYEIVPPDEDSVLDGITTTFPINQWNFWWASSEFNWWMGQDKVVSGVILCLALMAAAGTYISAEAFGVFARQPDMALWDEPVSEAA